MHSKLPHFKPPSIVVAILILALSTFPVQAQEPGQGKIDFNRQVKPILSDNCFACHGPDEAQRETEFRLDQKESALSTDYSVIVPSDIESSLLVERILSTDAFLLY